MVEDTAWYNVQFPKEGDDSVVNTFLRRAAQPVHVRRLVDLRPVGADSVGGVVIGEDENNVWPLSGIKGRQQDQPQSKKNNTLHISRCGLQLTS